MKEGWEYKKLGEVAEIQYGTRVVQKKDGGSIYPVYGGGGATFKMDSYNRENCLVVARFAMSPQCTRLVKGKFFLNDSGLTLRSYNLKTLSQDYLDKCILGHNNDIYLLSNGMAQKNLDVKAFRNMVIQYPSSIEGQKKIVSELDLLSGVIEKQKAQLEELDKLAQSIFYEMFGDPVANNKGWKVLSLGETGELGRGVSKHRPRNAPELLGGTMPLIQTGDVANAQMYITNYYSTYSDLGVSQSKVWKSGTLCITIAANIGKCAILSFDACFPDSVVGFSCREALVNNEYIYFIFQSLQKILERDAPAVAQKNINLAILNSIKIPLPPLSLQQEFAAKIEAIESMKAKVRQSLKEAETLFNSRMDYYFN